MTERAGEPLAWYPGMPAEGTRGRKHAPDSPEAAESHARVLRFAEDPVQRVKAQLNDAAVKR